MVKHILTNTGFVGESGVVFITYIIIEFVIENSKIS